MRLRGAGWSPGLEEGEHGVRFEAGHLPSGTSLVRFEAGAQVQTRYRTAQPVVDHHTHVAARVNGSLSHDHDGCKDRAP